VGVKAINSCPLGFEGALLDPEAKAGCIAVHDGKPPRKSPQIITMSPLARSLWMRNPNF
jgi:hypothetical protein